MKGTSLIIIGILFVAAGITGLVHPQWQGSDKKVEVDLGSRRIEVNTRRIIDIPPLFCAAVIVAGVCTAALGGITNSRAHSAQ